ncbi:MAG: phosphomannomutase/phosphoglucomutase [Actinomycetota bacterium]|nr:phosphomannomutase/phosphoglucomutase [Actinomycetota bacterium]
MTIELSSEIFRQYDIRGLVGNDLTNEAVYWIGRAAGTKIARAGGRNAAVGWDHRESSLGFSERLAKGLSECGLDVMMIGQCPTPVLYFAIYHLSAGGGLMITGSHNPPEFNGLKVNIGTETLYGDQIMGLREMILSGDLVNREPGKIESVDATGPYIDCLTKNVALGRPLSVVIDAGHGVAGPVAPKILEQLGCHVHCLYCDVDSTFPDHHPDPAVPENLKDMIEKVRSSGADVGLAFDGDADRLGVVDETGAIIWGDQLLAIYARDILAAKPGGKVIFDVKASELVEQVVAAAGGVPIMSRTGHSYIKERLRQEGALVGGEVSGHLFFADRYFGFDDAIYAALRLVELLSKTENKLSRLLDQLPKYIATPEYRVECDDGRKFAIVQELADYFARDHEVITIDGARVKLDGGWGLVRASNTQPALGLRFEAATQDKLDNIVSMFRVALKEQAGLELEA